MYRNIIRELKYYWMYYGGSRTLLRSPYFHFAFLFVAIFYPFWYREPWWSTAISVLPNLIGFTLGAYAILLAFGDELFRAALAGDRGYRKSPLMRMSAVLSHFIIVQIISLISAIGVKAWSSHFYQIPIDLNLKLISGKILLIDIVSPIFCFIFFYALLLSISTVISIFRVSRWYNRSQSD